MEERLSVIIDADIKNFQQGMARVEANLNRAQAIFKKASNAIFKTENAIAKLSKSFKDGSITNVQYSARLAHLNAELVKQKSNLSASSKEVDRLNKMMSSQASRQVVSSNQAASQSFQGLTKSVRGSNGVAIEFSRIIQDAPFGIIGIGNNIQQLTANFAQLKNSAGSTGAALKASLAAIISPANLLVLGISAVTAAFTAYQMGAFDFVTATDKAKTAQEEFNESLKNTNQTLKQGFFNELLKAQGLLKQENLGGRLVDVPAFETAEQVIQKLGSTINSLNKNELEALESFLSQRLADAARASANATTELEKTLANTNIIGYKEVLEKVNEQLKFYDTDTQKSTKSTKELQQEINSFSTDPLVDAYFEAIRAGSEFRKSLEEAIGGISFKESTVVDIPIKVDFNEEQLSEEQEKVIAAISNMQAAIRKLSEDVNKTIEAGLAGGITDLTGSITDAFMMGENVAHAAGKSLLATFATVLGQLGKLFIATGVGLQAVKKSLTTLNPVAAIAAGVGLVALSAAFGAGVKSIGAGMGSGGYANTGASQSFGGGMAPTAGLSQSHGFANASAFNPGSMDITLNARIGNDAIYLSNKSEENKRNRI